MFGKDKFFFITFLCFILLVSCQTDNTLPTIEFNPQPSIRPSLLPTRSTSASLTPPPVCTSSEGTRLSPDGKLITFEPECPQSATQKENIILESSQVKTDIIPTQAAQVTGTTFPESNMSPGEKIVFVGLQQQRDLYLTTLQGEIEPVTSDAFQESFPLFSPDFSTISYASDRLKRGQEIFQISILGKPFLRLTKNFLDSQPVSWSSQNELLFLNQGEVYRLNPETQATKRLLPGIAVSFAGWSPDGVQIAIVNQGNVLTVNREGLNARTEIEGLDITGKVDWSPDGQWLVYESRGGIFKVNLQEKQPSLLSNQGDSEPDWSPDGTQIVFTSRRGGSSGIYIMSSEGENQRKLSPDSIEAFQPDW